MATKALMVWTDAGDGVDPAKRQLVEQHHGWLDWQPGVAVFDGAAAALGAAVAWQEHETSSSPTTIAVTVVELDPEPGADDAATVIATTRELAASGDPGAILATELVYLLLPSPACGRWAEESGGAAVGARPFHQLLWERTTRLASISVVVAEDAAIIRAGIVSLLRADGMSVVGEAADYGTVIAVVRTSRPQLLITDVRMPPGQSDEGLRAAGILRAEQPGLSVLVLSQYVQASAAADLLTGQTSGIGYLLKERVTALDEFLEAARTVAGGGTVIDPLITQELMARNRAADQLQSLADRERAVLELMAQGLSNVAIADRLTLSARTVESHVRSIMTKLDLWEDPAGNRRVQAVIRWLHEH